MRQVLDSCRSSVSGVDQARVLLGLTQQWCHDSGANVMHNTLCNMINVLQKNLQIPQHVQHRGCRRFLCINCKAYRPGDLGSNTQKIQTGQSEHNLRSILIHSGIQAAFLSGKLCVKDLPPWEGKPYICAIHFAQNFLL